MAQSQDLTEQAEKHGAGTTLPTAVAAAAKTDRRCRVIEHQGQSLTVLGWAEQRNIAPRVLSERLSRGWPIERALTYPCRKGYLQGHAEQLAKGRAWWRANGKAWREGRAAAS